MAVDGTSAVYGAPLLWFNIMTLNDQTRSEVARVRRRFPFRFCVAAGFACGLLAVVSVLPGCGNQVTPETPGATGPYSVVATVGMVGDIVRNVAQDRAEVADLMGEGVDPHLYKATRDDVARMGAADVIFYSGLLLEGKMSDVLIRMSSSRPVVAVTERIDEAYLLEPEEFAGHFDPHVWMDPEAWALAVDVVAETLSEHDPDHASQYAAAAAAYREQVLELKAYGQEVLATVPEERRLLVTSHDAFNYFGRAFGLEVLGVQGISTESEAGLQQVNQLVDTLVSRRVEAVFVETSVPRKSIEALIHGARSRGHEVRIGGELFSDAMGARGSYEGTYLGMLDHNITTVARALGGDAPERGLHGRLGEPEGSESASAK